MSKKKNHKDQNIIALNRKAHHEFFIEQRFEAGMVLQGWEIKSIRAGRVNIKESYVLIKRGEAWLFGAHISPLPTIPDHLKPDPTRTRKLLLHQSEINKLIGKIEQRGYTAVPLDLHWKKPLVKCEIALAKGKQKFDKREAEKEKDWQRKKQQLLKNAR